MSSSGPKYQRVNADDSADASSVEMGTVVNPLQNSEIGQQALTVKILNRERVHEISALSPSDSVGRLKELVASATEVPVHLQRLVFSGRILLPNDKPLSFFNISQNASIHLFPIPAAVPVASVAAAPNAATASAVPSAVGDPWNRTVDGHHTPMHFDPTIAQHGREVKLWSTILLFLSIMALFNNVSYFSATGKLGSGTLDSIVFVLDTITSALGSWVGTLGLKSVRTLELQDVKKYVRWLALVAVCSIIMRVLWVFDVIYAVKRAVKESQDHSSSSDPSSTNTPDRNDGQTLDSKAVVTFGFQASIIAMICIFAWSSCFRRAVTFEAAVEAHSSSSQPTPTTATAVTDNTPRVPVADAAVASAV